jgi:hypothetical protein
MFDLLGRRVLATPGPMSPVCGSVWFAFAICQLRRSDCHPFIDVWAGVKPSVLGIGGVAAHPALGDLVHRPGARVLGEAEELIDFATTPGSE